MSSTAETSNDKKRKKDQVLMGNQEKHFKKEDTSSLSAPAPSPSNALEQLMLGANPPVVSKDEILDYLDRNPNWYYLFSELIRLEREEKNKSDDDDEEEQPKKPSPPPLKPSTRKIDEDDPWYNLKKNMCPGCKSFGDNVWGSCGGVMEICKVCGYLGEDPIRKVTEKIIGQNMKMICRPLIPPPTGLHHCIADYSDDDDDSDDDEYDVPINTGWSLTKELAERINLPGRLNNKQKNNLLPPPPNRPNKNATLTALEVHFRKEPERDTSMFYDPDACREYENEPYHPDIHCKKVCGFTFFYNDNTQIPVGYTEDDNRGGKKPIGRYTSKIELKKGEHIVAISDTVPIKTFAVRTTNNKWYVANIDPVEGRPHVPTARVKAPEGKAFQFFEVEDYHDCPVKEIQTPTITFVSIPDVNSSNNDGVGIPAVPPLYVKCEHTLQDYYQKKKATTHNKAYDDLKEIEKEHYEECEKFGQSFADRLDTSSEAKTIRILNHMINFVISKMEEKRDVLKKEASEAYEPVYEASELRIEQHKRAALKEQVQIYKDHSFFRRKCEFLKGNSDNDDDENNNDTDTDGVVVGTERQVCFLCRKVYQPKNLPFLKRCQARGCSSAFSNCGCGIKICRDKCTGIYCGDHCGHSQKFDSEWPDSDSE